MKALMQQALFKTFSSRSSRSSRSRQVDLQDLRVGRQVCCLRALAQLLAQSLKAYCYEALRLPESLSAAAGSEPEHKSAA